MVVVGVFELLVGAAGGLEVVKVGSQLVVVDTQPLLHHLYFHIFVCI